MKPTTDSIETISLNTWNRIGSRTFWLFLSKKITVPLTFLLLSIIFTIARSSSALPKTALPLLGLAGSVCIVVFVIALLYVLASSWFAYKSHEYCLAPDAFKVRQGVMTKQEMAIPYRQIQNVDIERSFSEQLFGLSRVIILTAGHEDATDKNASESEGILPAMDKRIAVQLQDELLRRADVQKVIQADQPAR